MPASLSLQQSPPFSVPARFLLSAPLFGLLAAVLMLYYGPEMIANRWTMPLLALTHLLTLGFIAMSMLGAMMQLVPVLMGVTMPWPVLFSTIIHLPLFFGSLCLVSAWLLQISELFIVAMVLLAFTFSFFILVLSQRLLSSKNRHVTRSMMLLALLALLITVCLGFYLAMAYAWPAFPLARQLTDLHLGWGLIGWVLLLIMAVAYQVIPMFQITDEYPTMHQTWMGWLLFVSLVIISLSYFWPLQTVRTVATLLLSGCLLIFALNTLSLLHKRRRKLPDVTMNFWLLAMSCLLLVVAGWLLSMITQLHIPFLLSGILMIHGFAMTAINGMMYKIVPFLIWLHLSSHNRSLREQGARELQVTVPHMRNIISQQVGLWQFRLHLLSLLLLLLAVIWPLSLFYPAALVFAAAQIALLVNLLKAVLLYKRKLAELGVAAELAC